MVDWNQWIMVGNLMNFTNNINTVKAWDRVEQFCREHEAFHDPQSQHSSQ